MSITGWMSRRDASPRVRAPAQSRARQILDQRLANGERTPEQYREQLKTLGENRY